MARTLVHLRPHDRLHYASLGETALVARRDGFFDGEEQCGLWFEKTRLLSRWRWLIEGREPQEVATSNVEQHSWLGFYVADTEGRPRQSRGGDPAQQTIELRLSRSVGGGMHEDVDVTNWSQKRVSLTLTLQVAADFAGRTETAQGRRQHGRLRGGFRKVGKDAWELRFDYAARHAFRHQGHQGVARMRRSVAIRIEKASSPPRRTRGRIHFSLHLTPGESWHACILCAADAEKPTRRCYAFELEGAQRLRERAQFLRATTRFGEREDLSDVVVQVLEQARLDLAALRLDDVEAGPDAFAVAAGLPLYTGLFGRDSLISADQAALLGPELLKGALEAMRKTQGRKDDPWRDEEPGRMLHQASSSPLARLAFTPLARYYGSACTGAFFCRGLAALWRWTGDEPRVRALLPAALAALDWTHRQLDDDEVFRYRTRSEQGLRNQGWKDSADAIVHADGRRAPLPIGTCEIQAFVYAADRELADLLEDLGEDERAGELRRKARAIRRAFAAAFWMGRKRFLALAIDGRGRQVRSIASNAGHCLEAGILDRAKAREVARRLMRGDLFSGWGVRTLSGRHPAFDPCSYHRGSVWPVEQGAFVKGLLQAGEMRLAHRLARALFEAAALFDYRRLPEVFGGQPRDARHPFPALYPRANSPQAWSASTVFRVVEALCGIEPDAPRARLRLRPRLPAWLPRLAIDGLRVGKARVWLEFFAPSQVRIRQVRGDLEIDVARHLL